MNFAHLLVSDLELSFVKFVWVRRVNSYVGRVAKVVLVLIVADLLTNDELSVLV